MVRKVGGFLAVALMIGISVYFLFPIAGREGPDPAGLKTLQRMGIPFTPEAFGDAASGDNLPALRAFFAAGMSPDGSNGEGLFASTYGQQNSGDGWQDELALFRKARMNWKKIASWSEFGTSFNRHLTQEEEVLYFNLTRENQSHWKQDIKAGADPTSLRALLVETHDLRNISTLDRFQGRAPTAVRMLNAEALSIRGVHLGMTKDEVVAAARKAGMSTEVADVAYHPGETAIEIRDPTANTIMSSNVGALHDMYVGAVGGNPNLDPNAPNGLKMFVLLSAADGKVFDIEARNAANDTTEGPRSGTLYELALKRWGQPNDPQSADASQNVTTWGDLSGISARWENQTRGVVPELDAGDAPSRDAWHLVVSDAERSATNQAKTEPALPAPKV